MAAPVLRLKVISPAATVYEGDVLRAVFPGGAGRFEVLPRHAPLLASLVKGRIVYIMPDGEAHEVAISSGFVEVKDNVITACVEL